MRRAARIIGEYQGEHFLEPVLMVNGVPCPCGTVLMGRFVAEREVWGPGPDVRTLYITCPGCFGEVGLDA